MLKLIAEEITVALASNDIIQSDEMEAYNYGLELLIPKVILYVAILIVSILTNSFLISFTFVVMLMSVRRYAGGFHCKTAETCLLFSFLIYLFMLFGYHFIKYFPPVSCGLISVISAIVVMIYAPAEDINRPLEETEKVQYRKKSLLSLTIILLVELTSVIFNLSILSYVSACSLTANAVLILLSKTRRCNHEVIRS